jgi:hypothetical protein
MVMHVSSWNMFPTIRNLQIHVHVYYPRHCCGDWLTFGCVAQKKNGSHDMKQTDSSIIIVRNVCVPTSASMIVYLFFTRSWSAIIGPKLFFMRSWFEWFKVILHQFWVKKIFPWKFNLKYGGTFTKLFMHVSSRNMVPTTRNLQIRVHLYRPRHCCGDWLTFGCFVPMIADHDLVKKR